MKHLDGIQTFLTECALGCVLVAFALVGGVFVLIYLAVVAAVWPVIFLLSRFRKTRVAAASVLPGPERPVRLSESERKVFRLGMREVLK